MMVKHKIPMKSDNLNGVMDKKIFKLQKKQEEEGKKRAQTAQQNGRRTLRSQPKKPDIIAPGQWVSQKVQTLMSEEELLSMYHGIVDPQALRAVIRDHEAWKKIKFASEDELQRFKSKVLADADDPNGHYSLFFDEQTRRATQS